MIALFKEKEKCYNNYRSTLTGLKEFQVEIGHVDFFHGLVDEAGFDNEEEVELRDLIEEKNIFGVERLIEEKDISADLKEVFYNLAELFGSLDVL